MHVTLAFDPEDNADLTITVSGMATRDEFVSLYRALPDDPRFRPGMNILLDFWELRVTALSSDDARDIGRDLAAQEPRYGRARLAVFAPAPVVFGLSRMAELTGQFKQMEISVSDTYDEAIEWLGRVPRQSA
jgi:hypothetical protein